MPDRLLTPGVTCGVFGKLPGAGDFLRLNVAPPAAAALDAWLERELAALAMDEAAWEEAFDHAPAWRFVLDRGMAGADATAGVLMPSRDACGRRFPCAILSAAPGCTLEDLAGAGAWFDRVETALATAIAEGADGRALAEAMRALGRAEADAGDAFVLTTRSTPDGLFADVEGAHDTRAEALRAVLETSPPAPGSSAWWRHPEGRTRLMLTPGLPRGAAFAALFRGRAPAPEAVPAAVQERAA